MQDFHGDIPGFQGVTNGAKADGLLQGVIRKPLTQSLGTEPSFRPA